MGLGAAIGSLLGMLALTPVGYYAAYAYGLVAMDQFMYEFTGIEVLFLSAAFGALVGNIVGGRLGRSVAKRLATRGRK